MKINYRFILSFLVFVVALFLLGSGSDWLLQPIFKGVEFPLGTMIAWAGIIALPLTLFFGSKSISHPTNSVEKIVHKTFKFLIILGCLWGFMSYWLAGNWSFNFFDQDKFRGSSQAFEYFKIMTVVLVLLPLVVGFFYAIKKTFMGLQKFREKNKS